MDKFLIFKNNRKEKENQPDYNVMAKNERGDLEKVGACWLREVKGKVDSQGKPAKYFSCQMNKPLTEAEKAQIKTLREAGQQGTVVDISQIPF